MGRPKKIKFTEKEYTKYMVFLYAISNGKIGDGLLLSYKERYDWMERNNLSQEQIDLMNERLETEVEEIIELAINKKVGV